MTYRHGNTYRSAQYDTDDAWRESLADACNAVGCDLTEAHEIGDLIETLVDAQAALDWISSNVDLPTHLLPQYRELLRAADLTHRSVMERLDQYAPDDEFDGLGYESAWPMPEAPHDCPAHYPAGHRFRDVRCDARCQPTRLLRGRRGQPGGAYAQEQLAATDAGVGGEQRGAGPTPVRAVGGVPAPGGRGKGPPADED